MRLALVVATIMTCVVLVALWAGPRAQQVERPPAPSPTAEEEAGGIGDPLESPLRGAPRLQAPAPSPKQIVPLGTSARQTPPSVGRDPTRRNEDTIADEAGPQLGLQRVMPIKSSHGREEDVLASGDGRPNHELEAGQPAGSLHSLALLTPPVLKAPIFPGYPPDAMHLFLDRDALAPKLRAEAGQGRVVLKILVRADGSVANVDVATSTGTAILDDAAVRAAWGWQFEPATRDGQPITAWAFVPVRFVQR